MNVQTLPNKSSHSAIHALDELIPAHIWAHGGIIEVISEQHDLSQLRLILPALERLAKNGRWLAWVGSPFRCTSESLQQLSTDPFKLLQVYPGKQTKHLSVLGKALSTGRCSAVMAWSKQHNDHELQQLKQAARKGNAIGILLSQQNPQQTQHTQADLQLTLQHTGQGLMINLKAPHLLGQRCYHLVNTPEQKKRATLASQSETDANQQPSQLSFF